MINTRTVRIGCNSASDVGTYTFTLAGKAFAAWQSVRKCKGQDHFTLDEIESLFLGKPEELERLAQSIGELSRPRLGNEEPAAAEAGTSTAGRAA